MSCAIFMYQNLTQVDIIESCDFYNRGKISSPKK